MVTLTPWLPAAVDAVCEPCPFASRGERYSNFSMLPAPNPLTK